MYLGKRVATKLMAENTSNIKTLRFIVKISKKTKLPIYELRVSHLLMILFCMAWKPVLCIDSEVDSTQATTKIKSKDDKQP